MKSPVLRSILTAAALCAVPLGFALFLRLPALTASRAVGAAESQATPVSTAVAPASPAAHAPMPRRTSAGRAAPASAPGSLAEAELDPEALAIWEAIEEADQQTLQPEDLEVEPPTPLPDLRSIPAYRALNIDADGNLN